MKLEHVAINVPDPKAFAQWYVDNLGMQIVRALPDPPYMTFIADSAGQSMLEIYNDVAAGVPDYSTIHHQNLHFAFSADDMEGTIARLEAAGASQIGTTTTTPLGDQLAFLRDPWNVTVQLVKRKTPML